MASSLPAKTYAQIPVKLDLPNLIEVQLDSFERLKREGLGDLFHEISPIERIALNRNGEHAGPGFGDIVAARRLLFGVHVVVQEVPCADHGTIEIC